jgi:hypothetical protein
MEVSFSWERGAGNLQLMNGLLYKVKVISDKTNEFIAGESENFSYW